MTDPVPAEQPPTGAAGTRKPLTWRALAHRLGERMYNHAFCDTHSLADADPRNCPFCDDREAYRQYADKARRPAR